MPQNMTSRIEKQKQKKTKNELNKISEIKIKYLNSSMILLQRRQINLINNNILLELR